jgi:hypothetical protein
MHRWTLVALLALAGCGEEAADDTSGGAADAGGEDLPEGDQGGEDAPDPDLPDGDEPPPSVEVEGVEIGGWVFVTFPPVVDGAYADGAVTIRSADPEIMMLNSIRIDADREGYIALNETERFPREFSGLARVLFRMSLPAQGAPLQCPAVPVGFPADAPAQEYCGAAVIDVAGAELTIHFLINQ